MPVLSKVGLDRGRRLCELSRRWPFRTASRSRGQVRDPALQRGGGGLGGGDPLGRGEGWAGRQGATLTAGPVPSDAGDAAGREGWAGRRGTTPNASPVRHGRAAGDRNGRSGSRCAHGAPAFVRRTPTSCAKRLATWRPWST